jgi:hypothetical protein
MPYCFYMSLRGSIYSCALLGRNHSKAYHPRQLERGDSSIINHQGTQTASISFTSSMQKKYGCFLEPHSAAFSFLRMKSSGLPPFSNLRQSDDPELGLFMGSSTGPTGQAPLSHRDSSAGLDNGRATAFENPGEKSQEYIDDQRTTCMSTSRNGADLSVGGADRMRTKAAQSLRPQEHHTQSREVPAATQEENSKKVLQWQAEDGERLDMLDDSTSDSEGTMSEPRTIPTHRLLRRSRHRRFHSTLPSYRYFSPAKKI